MSVKWIEYKGKRILYADFRGLRGKELIETIELEAQMVAAHPTKVLILDNFEGVHTTTAFVERIKQLGKDIIEEKTIKNAVLGITGLKDILLRAYNTFTKGKSRPFGTEADALEWLVQK